MAENFPSEAITFLPKFRKKVKKRTEAYRNYKNTLHMAENKYNNG